MMKSATLVLGVGLPICLAASVLAQSVPRVVPPDDAAVMTCNDRFVYVLRSGELLQFDATTLQLKRRQALPGASAKAVEVVNEPVLIRADKWTEWHNVGKVKDKGKSGMVGQSVRRGIAWLVAHQDDEGYWDADGFMEREEGKRSDGAGNPVHDVGVTGLVVLALLGDGNTLREGPQKAALLKAVAWLRAQQDPDSGLIGTNAASDFIYDHAIATYALTEAYGLSQYKLLKRNAQKAINYLEGHRNPYSVWRYQPMDNDNDTSVTSWCVLAYRSAKDFGLQVNPNALKIADAWFDQMTDPVSGRTGYTKRGGMSSRMVGDHANRFPREKDETMTAMALYCRLLLTADSAEKPDLAKQANLVFRKLPEWDVEGGRITAVGRYFGTQAMYQMGGRYWQKWSGALQKTLLSYQRTEGNARGSWDPVGVWGESGGRVYATALNTLSLETLHRYDQIKKRVR